MTPFRPIENNKELDAQCSVKQLDEETFRVHVPSTGGSMKEGVPPRNTQRTAARTLLVSRLSAVNAVVLDYQIGESEPQKVVPPTAMSQWSLPKKISTKRLSVRIRLPPATPPWDESSLANQLRAGDRYATPAAGHNHHSSMEYAAMPVDSIIAKLRGYRNLIVEGVAGTGKSHLIQSLMKEFGDKRVRVVVFHPATSYEDFVEGLRPQGEGFAVRDGVFLELCREAAASASTVPEGRDDATDSATRDEWVLVIDEINRANTAKVLGDLLYAIEPSKRVEPRTAHDILSARATDPIVPVGTPTPARLSLERPAMTAAADDVDDRRPTDAADASSSLTYRQRFVVPANLYILGTMNTTDRSVGTIDLALRRRFVILRMEPMQPKALKEALKSLRVERHVNEWARLNGRLRQSIGPDALLGHSYFFEFSEAVGRNRPDHDLDIWRDLLLPQLAEILVAFNAVDRVRELLDDIDTGDWTLEPIGTGVDGYPIVVRRTGARG